MAKRYFIGDIELLNVHDEALCAERVCVIHNPTRHGMSDWEMLWRDDRGIVERVCPECGCCHPDPDQEPYWEESNQLHQGVHGCCGNHGKGHVKWDM